MKRIIAASLSLVALFAVQSSASATVSMGDTLTVDYLYTDTSTVYDSNTTTFTGAGTTFLPVINTGTVAFDSNSVVITQNGSWLYSIGSTISFNGVRITDDTNAAAFAGWSVDPLNTTWTGFTEYLSGGSIYIDFQGTTTDTTTILTVSSVSAVPEPSTWAMMVLGFAAVGFLGARRLKKPQLGVV